MQNDKLSAMMVDDFIHDPILAVRCIFGKLLPPLTPYQQARLWAMWTKTYMIDSSGYGTGKSMCIAIIAMLRCILAPDRVVGVLNKTAEQARLLFKDYIDPWSKRSRFLRTQIAFGMRGGLAIVHGSESHEVKFKNGSICRAMTANPGGEFQNIKTQSWSDGMFDEWTAYAFGEAFDKWVIGRVRKPVPQGYDPHHPAYRQHFFFCGTPMDTDHPCFPRVEEYRRGMAEKPEDFAVMSWNHSHIPTDGVFNPYRVALQSSLLDMARRLSPDSQEREIMGRWTTVGSSWYTMGAIRKCAEDSHAAPILLAQEPGDAWTYFIGVDVARGGLHLTLPEHRSMSGGDDAAFSVWRSNRNPGVPDQHVMSWRIHGIESRQMSAVLHRANIAFNPMFIVLDPGGGGIEIRDNLRSPEQDDGKERFQVQPIATMDDPGAGTSAARKLVLFSRADDRWGMVGVQTKWETDLNNRMHQDFQAAIIKGLVAFPSPWPEMPMGIGARELRTMLNLSVGMSLPDKARAEAWLALLQLANIRREVTRDGLLKLDREGQPTFGSKFKKDAAYALAYGFMGCWLWRRMQEMQNFHKPKDRKSVIIFSDA
jgi:hypothetical protein